MKEKKCFHLTAEGSTLEKDMTPINPVLRCTVCGMIIYVKVREEDV